MFLCNASLLYRLIFTPLTNTPKWVWKTSSLQRQSQCFSAFFLTHVSVSDGVFIQLCANGCENRRAALINVTLMSLCEVRCEEAAFLLPFCFEVIECDAQCNAVQFNTQTPCYVIYLSWVKLSALVYQAVISAVIQSEVATATMVHTFPSASLTSEPHRSLRMGLQSPVPVCSVWWHYECEYKR